VPMFDVTELVGHWGYLAVFAIVVVGNVGVPVPEETALLAAGYLVWRGDLRWSLVLMVGIVSAVAGDNVGYWIGRRYGPGVLERFRRLIGISPPRFQSMRTFILRWGPLGVFVARFLAGLRFLAGPLAGAAGLHFSAFMTANVLGALLYVPAVVAAGYAVGYGAGAYVERVLQARGPLAYIVLAVAVILVGSVFVWRTVRAFSDRAGP
jgi:membrane protein DedA with SNARE-associated domain